MPSQDIRSPLAKARDKWLETKRTDIDALAKEASTHSKYIEARLERAFLDGASAQASSITKQQLP